MCIGISAQIALNFHNARDETPTKFTSRRDNLYYYGSSGIKDLFTNEWANLMDYVTIELDGKDFTQTLKDYGTHEILFLNIKVCNIYMYVQYFQSL